MHSFLEFCLFQANKVISIKNKTHYAWITACGVIIIRMVVGYSLDDIYSTSFFLKEF